MRSCNVASCTPLTGALAHNPGMCPNWESNRRPLVHRPMLNPLSYTSQGYLKMLKETADFLFSSVIPWCLAQCLLYCLMGKCATSVY